MNRLPQFELHIRPMFHLIDREHMKGHGGDRDMDLWDYDSVVKYSHDILVKLRTEGNPMPPLTTGGPWPDEWIALFERWVSAQCPRLELAAGTYTATPHNAEVILAAIGNTSVACNVWLYLKSIASDKREYILYAEPSSDSQTTFSVIDEFEAPDDPSEFTIIVHDCNGEQEVPITSN